MISGDGWMDGTFKSVDLANSLMTFALHLVEQANSVLGKLVLSLLQLCKQAASHPGGADILGRKQRVLLSGVSGLFSVFMSP